MLTRSQYSYLKDTIVNDPDIGRDTRNLMIGLLFIYFKRDMQNFNQKRWLHLEDERAIKKGVESVTSHTFESANTKSNS